MPGSGHWLYPSRYQLTLPSWRQAGAPVIAKTTIAISATLRPAGPAMVSPRRQCAVRRLSAWPRRAVSRRAP